MIGNVELKRMLQCLIAFIILYKKRKVTVKKIKALQQRPKGWKLSSSPDRTILELFV